MACSSTPPWYTPREQHAPAPCIFTLTPYIAQSYHDRGVYFAAHGLPFLTIDVRGRGSSQGEFHPFIQEARDGYDIVEWLAQQPYCNGKVSMWGGSYAGYDQWATAKEFPPHLATIVPVASPYAGVDFPMQYNIFFRTTCSGLPSPAAAPHRTGSLATRSSGNRPIAAGSSRAGPSRTSTSCSAILTDLPGMARPSASRHIGTPTIRLPSNTPGSPSRFSPSPAAMTTISREPSPIYREYMKSASPEARARHYLVIGPWDHAGTRTPKAEFGGLTFGEASLVDLPKLHVDWYGWTMQGGAKPAFLAEGCRLLRDGRRSLALFRYARGRYV